MCTYASDSLLIKINKQQFQKEDTVSFTCTVPGFIKDSIFGATLNVIIEDVDNRNIRWKYRYPILNGEASGDLIINNSVPDGNYAINFIVQKKFLSVEGRVKDYKAKQSFLSYLVLGKYETHYFDIITPMQNGYFKLKSLLFVDTAYFVFTPSKKKSIDYLWIDIKTSLDSVFTPYAVDTKFLTVGSPEKPAIPSEPYHFDFNKSYNNKTTLPDVVVTTNKKKLVDKFNEEYSSGMFNRNVYQTYDGLESDEIAHSINIYEFLKGRVPGLNVKYADGQYSLSWRGAGVSVYLDEFSFPITSDEYIDPSEVAMIKVFSPPAYLGNNTRGGAIAIYTKKGAYDVNPNRKNKFKVLGYTPAEYDWQ
jgi:hypothetical protein